MSQIILQTLDFSSLGFPSVGEFYLGVDVDGIPKLRRYSDTIPLYATSSGYLQYFSVSYSDFLNLYNTSSLESGSVYVINDFRTSHYIQYTDSVGDGTGLGESINFGTVEPIIVVATSNSTYDRNVKSLLYPDDEIKWVHELTDREYDHYNNPAGVGRGHIVYRKSSAGNSRDYDFRNVVFWRWNDGSGNYTVVRRVDAPNIFDYKVYKSVDEDFSNVENNYIGSYKLDNYYLDNLIILTSSVANYNRVELSHAVTINGTFINNHINSISNVVINSNFSNNNINEIKNTNINCIRFSDNNSNTIDNSNFKGEFRLNNIQLIDDVTIGTAIGNSKLSIKSITFSNVYSYNSDPFIIDTPLDDTLISLKNSNQDIFKVTLTMSSIKYNSQEILIDDSSISLNGDLILSTMSSSPTLIEYVGWDKSSKRIKYLERDKNKIFVSKSGGDFTSISDAINSITDAGTSNRYTISVSAGDYYEDTIILKPFTTIVGSDRSTRIFPKTNNQHIFIGSNVCTVASCLITGAGVGYSAFYHTSNFLPSGVTASQAALVIKDCIFGQNDTHVTCYADSERSTVQVVDCRYGSSLKFNTGFFAYNNNNNTAARILLLHCYSQGMSITSPTYFAKASGNNCEIVMNSVQCNAVNIISGSNFLWLENGAKCKLNGVNFTGFDYGIYNPNIGNPANIEILSTICSDTNVHISINNPNTFASISGSFEKSKVFSLSDAVSITANDKEVGDFVITGGISINYTNSIRTDISTLISQSSPMGLIKGGEISDGGGLTLNIATGFGYLHIENNTDSGILKKHSWGLTSISIDPNTTSYIFWNSSLNLSKDSLLPNTSDSILLGRVRGLTNSFEFIERTPLHTEHWENKTTNLFRKGFGPIYTSGSIVSESTPFKIDVSQGKYYFGSNEINPSGGTSISFSMYYRNNPSGFIISGTDSIINSYYDNGSGILATMSSGYYTKHSLYTVGDLENEKYFLVVGQQEYSSQTLAELGDVPTPPSYFTDAIALISGIIVREGTSSISSIIDERPRVGFAPPSLSTTSNHSSLLNLSSDDHPQYLPTNGGRSMSSNLSIGGNSIINVNLVDGVDVSSHQSRHLPNGSDPLTTGTPSSIGTTNQIGIQNAFARMDHIHEHGNLNGGALHSIVSATSNGFMSSIDKSKMDYLLPSTQSSVIITATSISISAGIRDSIGNFGSVGSLLSSTGTGSRWRNLNYSQKTVTSAPSTNSAIGVMMGLSASITPLYSGVVQISITGDSSNTNNGQGSIISVRYGTGTPPVNGAVLTGTTVGGPINAVGQSGNRLPFTLNVMLPNIIIGTEYWIDLGVSVTGNTSQLRGINILITEM